MKTRLVKGKRQVEHRSNKFWLGLSLTCSILAMIPSWGGSPSSGYWNSCVGSSASSSIEDLFFLNSFPKQRLHHRFTFSRCGWNRKHVEGKWAGNVAILWSSVKLLQELRANLLGMKDKHNLPMLLMCQSELRLVYTLPWIWPFSEIKLNMWKEII